jgi:subtilase family serine protease
MSFRKIAAVCAGGLVLGWSIAAAGPVVQHGKHGFNVATCPAAIGPGLARCFTHLSTDASGAPIRLVPNGPGRAKAAQPNTTPPPYVLPIQVRAAYNITGLGSPSTTVAIVDAFGYPNAEADLANFRSFAGLPPCTKANHCLRIVNQGGGSTPPVHTDVGWIVEQAADLDTVSTMCPNCHILLVEAERPTGNDLAAAVRTAAAMGARVISNSYGGGEIGSAPFEGAYNVPGVAVTASTGDSGYGAQFPATSPHVIAVGGTTLNMSGLTRLSETVWSGSGSGCSTVYGQPKWQTPSNANMANNTLCTMRMEADVSADADPDTGVILYMNNPPYPPGLYIVGGTSISNQIVAGIFGEVGGLVTYASGIYAHSGALFDVTSGTNAPPSCGGTYFCVAGTGYDGPTGLGTPNGDTAF